ncbi:energy-coupling factor transporter transmembrane component T family protein [Corynebacterium doosanense]|uniref:ABC transporter n=1 Tax=Corynebacterium doosanense CAU 212 = DSM 45436 TaxID=558173 RepID=A0A097IF39_9CORY|nr:energy-coupling factor transporter transmembrane component T [Corynebacterium doosanense]AIT60762.1 ABC transporter [Corynebacterium doosanense CAU 212 = DSM 45436]
MNLLSGVNPVSRVLALALLTTPLLLSVDVVSAAVVLVATVVLAPLCGVGPLRLLRRAWPLLIAAPLAAVSMALFGNPRGESYLQFGLFHVTDNSLSLAAAILVRVLAIGVPVVVLMVDIDPTELGDGLAQVLRLPARFVVATIAAVRLIGLLRDDLAGLRRARRARGLADRTGPRYLFSLAFGLLVSALRRAGKLSTAMEARGFGATERTWARESRLHPRDGALLVVSALLGVGAIAVAVWTGHFRFLGVG